MTRLTTKGFLTSGILAIGTTVAACNANAADDVTMRIEARPDSAAATRVQFNVTGGPTRYDHADATQVSIPIALHAETTADADDRKIVTSVLFLKANDKSKVTAFDDGEPQSDMSLEKTFTLSADGKSTVAQDAIAACNAQFPGGARGAAPALATVRVPIVWRVTTGKFNFRWTNYDRVAPSEDFVKNPDFYAERKSVDQEKTFDIKVGCLPLSAQAIARNPETPAGPKPETIAPAAPPVAVPVAKSPTPSPTPPAPAATAAVTSNRAAQKSDMLPVKPSISEPAPVSPPAQEPKPDDANSGAITPAQAASVAYTASPKKPVCDGGMVRKIHSAPDAFLCLCPGNTSRVEKADNAFACQKKAR